MMIFFLEIAVMLFMALLCGQGMRMLRLPAVLGELFGGIILGPTVWGWLSPSTYNWLFPESGAIFYGRDALIQICMLFFLFAAGLEMNLSLVKKRSVNIAWASLMGIAIPFVLGFGMIFLFPDIWRDHFQGKLMFFAMFMGTALSISALPVIARTLMDLDLMKTDMGMIITGAATIDDLVGWSLFAFILSNFAPESILDIPPYMTFVLVFLLFAFMLTVGRTLAQKVQKRLEFSLTWPGSFLGITTVFILLAAACAEAIGIHAVFGAFLVGLAFSQGLEKRDDAHEMIHQFVMYFFAPLYFVSIGLRADFVASFDLTLVLAVLIIACIGKIFGVTLGLIISKLPLRQSAVIGVAMNARGAMEMILATVAKDAGLIDDQVFVALIIMALLTSLLTGPAVSRLSGFGHYEAD
ncbi:cation:proton antiporter [Methanosarcina sp. UBA411]|jgi:Kef-type K+ transport system membrane component KefB|uniref:cation:proton antiporter n=1 Tax=Methanosarcina sp. UBA411 TaxID=1915589 RepID=UPI0025FBB2FF|nr:cation:proton antiporter [Methanosarcina sp. UBA411]